MRRKLQMDLGELVVESFPTGSEMKQRGTVHGHGSVRCDENSNTCDTIHFTCDGANTCFGDTCDHYANTCILSCGICGTYKCG
jgi:hypothetical protein